MVGRPLVWVGLGTAAVAGAAVAVVAVVAIVGVVVVALVLASGEGEALRVSTPPLVATAQGPPEPVVSCDSGIAVTNPATNTELVGDCESLLGLRDTIRGTGKLNWAAGKPMSEWMGVTVSGTPQRVTALNLADLGLDGELSGLLGELTGLTTLDLSGNVLTGMIPSKLALLENLTTVSLAGTSFTGCAPDELGDVATNDVTLDDCGDPVDWWTDATAPRMGDTIPSGTYRFPIDFTEDGVSRAIVFDIPPGAAFIFAGVWTAQFDGMVSLAGAGGETGIVIEPADGTGRAGLDLEYGGAWGNTYTSDDATAAVAEGLERILESWWHDDP